MPGLPEVCLLFLPRAKEAFSLVAFQPSAPFIQKMFKWIHFGTEGAFPLFLRKSSERTQMKQN